MRCHLPPSAWRTITLDLPHRKYRTPQFFEQKARPRERIYGQFFIIDLGHERAHHPAQGSDDRLGRPQLPPPFTSINLNAVFFVFSGRNQAWPQVSPRRGHRTFGGTFYEASGTSAQQPRQPCPAPPVAKKAQDWKIPVHPPFPACNILKRMFEFERLSGG
jgi:hypothetical protein